MAVTVTINGTDRTSVIDRAGFDVTQILGSQRDTAHFTYKKFGSRTYVPAMYDSVLVQDGSTQIFGGRIVNIVERVINPAEGVQYQIECADYSVDLDSVLIANTYTNMSVADIIADMLTNVTGFTSVNVASTYVVAKIVFNQMPISQCIKRLADILRYDWYVDPAKDVHFYPKYTETAPYGLTDTSGNYVNRTLERKLDGTQIANQVKVRGGYYNAATYSSSITVKGTVSKSFILPYQFSGLTITLNGVSKTVGIDNIDDFTTKDVLYSFQDYSIRFQNNLADGDVIAYSGSPKVRVLAIASDASSIATYGLREKLIEDTSIEDISIARTRATAELNAYKDQQNNGSFETYTAGLRAGMVINLTSTIRGANVDFIIRSVKFAPRTPTTFGYKVEVVSTRLYDLTEILQTLLQPASLRIEDAEVAEIIKTDIATVTITELISVVAATGVITETVTISENIQKDPIGAGVEPIWVLGPYFPSSISDTKRVGILNQSLKVY